MNILLQAAARLVVETRRSIGLAAALLVFGMNAGAASLTPPSAQFVDKFGVNLLNGQVNSSLETVSIGGAMGLAHAISLYSNHFERTGQRGYIDRFGGAAKFSQLVGPGFVWPVMRVHDMGGSVDFRIRVGGAYYTGNGQESATSVTYSALRDPRHQLVVTGAANEFLDWIKPDGTVTRFGRAANPRINADGRLLQITSPSGFTIYFDYLSRVFTNTGYSLVYQYEQDTRSPDYAADANAPAGAPPYSIAEWALHNPRYVRAVNNAVCSTGSTTCMQRKWPTATFTWPAGMPRTMYIGRRAFSVDTPSGRTTFEYEPYDLAKDGNVVVSGYVAGQRISPRLRSIKPATNQSVALEYTYKNLFQYTSIGLRDDLFGVEFTPPPGMFPSGMGDYATLVQDAGVILTARLIDERNAYDMGEVYMNESWSQNVGGLVGRVWRVITAITNTPPTTSSVDTVDEQVIFESSARNFPIQVRWQTGVIEDLAYTPRGNLKSITTNGVVSARAVYANEDACLTMPRICNEATSIFDAKGNETRYEYHAASGQLSRVIPPADPNGKIAEVRFEYQELQARYYDANGNRIYGTPIYLKVAERHCHDSNYSSANAAATCLGADEVVTRFYYGHDNLLLTSMTTMSPDGTLLRTCYQYDVYGNKLGETQPKGATNCG